MVVLFAFGNRAGLAAGFVSDMLDRLAPGGAGMWPAETAVWTGDARGADEYVTGWARGRKLPVQIFEADWDGLGKRAGAERTKQLVHRLPAGSVCVAFVGIDRPEGSGWRLRDVVSAGTKISIELCLGREFDVTVVWNDGTTSLCVHETAKAKARRPNEAVRAVIGDEERRAGGTGESKHRFEGNTTIRRCQKCGRGFAAYQGERVCETCN